MARTSRISSVSSPRSANRRSLPKHLPCVEEVIEPELTGCGSGGGLHRIGEDGEPLGAIRLRANKSETFDCLKFTLDGAAERSDGYARTSARTSARTFGVVVACL